MSEIAYQGSVVQSEHHPDAGAVRRMGGVMVVGTFTKRHDPWPYIAVVQYSPGKMYELPQITSNLNDSWQPETAAKHILLAQTGYGYNDSMPPNTDVFRMAGAFGATEINNPYYLVIMRGLEMQQPSSSVHKLGAVSVRQFLSGLQEGASTLLGAEGAAAFMKAGQNSYRTLLRNWLVQGNDAPKADVIRKRLAPWLVWEPSHA